MNKKVLTPLDIAVATIAKNEKAEPEPMTQQECENWIVLKGQSGERWFELKILDPEVGQDPTMVKLMETVNDMIFQGIQGMPFMESEKQRAKDADKSKSDITLKR
jgi:hypothetical protein